MVKMRKYSHGYDCQAVTFLKEKHYTEPNTIGTLHKNNTIESYTSNDIPWITIIEGTSKVRFRVNKGGWVRRHII